MALFLSTLSLRRATVDEIPNQRKIDHFYPRSPCGERPEAVTTFGAGSDISIHALLAESDASHLSKFNTSQISIHALLAESDNQSPPGTTRTTYFYPRSPCGERLEHLLII